MFGYIKPCKPQMRVCEYETYKAVYCGLCKQLGRKYGPFSRLTLSYDFTFLALLDLAMKPEGTAGFCRGRCLLNPFRQIPCLGDSPELLFSSGVAMIMFYYKAMDNFNDGGFRKKALSTLSMPFARYAYRKAADQYPEAAQIIYAAISKQSLVEEEQCDSVDRACEPTALALSGICSLLSQEKGQKRVLERFGYLLGRYVYLADALDDLEEDARQGSYNAFLLREHLSNPTAKQLVAIRENAKGSLFLTIAELIKTYGLLELHTCQPILDNILHLGLHETVERIMKPKETEHE